MRAWLWPHLAWAYALGPATILVVGVPSDIVTYTMNAAIDSRGFACRNGP